MILTIWRHGEAGPAASDRERELTARGADDLGFGGKQFHAACQARELASPGVILHSPWLRTTQTAEILAAAFSHARVSADSSLRPGAGIGEVDASLAGLEPVGAQHVLLVSHQPLVSMLVEYYLGDFGAVPGLPPGGLATLALHEPAAGCANLLFWSLPPEYEAGL